MPPPRENARGKNVRVVSVNDVAHATSVSVGRAKICGEITRNSDIQNNPVRDAESQKNLRSGVNRPLIESTGN